MTTGDPKIYETGTDGHRGRVGGRHRPPDRPAGGGVHRAGRDAAELGKILLTGFTPDLGRPLSSLDAFVDFAGEHARLAIDEIVLHWPIADSAFVADLTVFEKIATEGLARLDG